MKKNNIKTYILIIVVIVLVAILGIITFRNIGLTPADRGNEESVYITISSGNTWDDVLAQMDEAGLLKNVDKATSYVYSENPPLYENTYVVTKDMSVKEIIDVLEQPDTNMNEDNSYQIVVYEGALLTDIAYSFEVNTGGLITSDELLKLWSDKSYLKDLIDEYWFLTDEILNPYILYPLEGYFTPATYVIGPDATAESVTTMMLDGTATAWAQYEGATFPNGYTLHEIVTLASIIERETATDYDKYMVSGVFYNRFEEGMKLQSDITTIYALGSDQTELSYDDLETESPYNTYYVEGLPPGPIASPSVTSIDAAINPTESDYFYFFALQDTGEVIYTETYEEHMEVVEANPWV